MPEARKVLDGVLKSVSYETEIPITEIVSRNSNAEVVDARWICVQILKECGYYPTRIAQMMHITARYVQYIITEFHSRVGANKLMRTNYERARNKLRSH